MFGLCVSGDEMGVATGCLWEDNGVGSQVRNRGYSVRKFWRLLKVLVLSTMIGVRHHYPQ
jgi:hypothetical protein